MKLSYFRDIIKFLEVRKESQEKYLDILLYYFIITLKNIVSTPQNFHILSKLSYRANISPRKTKKFLEVLKQVYFLLVLSCVKYFP